MFPDKMGHLRADAEVISERIKELPEEEVEALEERQSILRDVLNSLSARTEELTGRDRRATFSLLYKDIIATVFDFQLALEVSEARARIAHAKTKEEKFSILLEFRARAQTLAILHGIR